MSEQRKSTMKIFQQIGSWSSKLNCFDKAEGCPTRNFKGLANFWSGFEIRKLDIGKNFSKFIEAETKFNDGAAEWRNFRLAEI